MILQKINDNYFPAVSGNSSQFNIKSLTLIPNRGNVINAVNISPIKFFREGSSKLFDFIRSLCSPRQTVNENKKWPSGILKVHVPFFSVTTSNIWKLDFTCISWILSLLFSFACLPESCFQNQHNMLQSRMSELSLLY